MHMHRTSKVIAVTSLVAAAAVLLSACQYGGQPAPTGSTTGQTSTQQVANAVTIQNMAFAPQNLQVKVGQTVTWTNKDQRTHTVTSDTGAFDSGNVASNGSYSFTFTKAGTFPYHCNIHTSMKAQVTVTE